MATAYNTGAVHAWTVVPNRIFLGDGAGGVLPAPRPAFIPGGAIALAGLNRTALYLGTGERGHRIRIRRKTSPVYNDLGGPELPFDELDAGMDGFVFMTLTRWEEPVYRILSTTPFPGATVLAQGPNDIGTLMTTEGAAFPLILRFQSVAARPAMVAAGYPTGMRLYSCSLVEDDDWEPGTAANKRHLIFHSRRVYVPGRGNLVLGDYLIPSAIPPIAPT